MTLPKPRSNLRVTASYRSADAPSVARPARQTPTATISLRLPKGMLDELKRLAKQRDVPYHSLLKVFLSDRMVAERWRLRSDARPRLP